MGFTVISSFVQVFNQSTISTLGINTLGLGLCDTVGMDRYETVLEDIRAFVKERDWAQFHDPKNLAMAVGSEAGELLSELRWIEGDASDAHCKDPETRQGVVDEICDVAVCLLMLSERINLDLLPAIHEKMKKNRAKYPTSEWRGK